MCGIAGFYLKDSTFKVNHERLIDEMLLEIEHRGGDACGLVAIGPEGLLAWEKAAVDVKDFIRYRHAVPEGATVVLLHTRYATQGPAGFMENNHPLNRGPFYVIHNGHVWNDDQLFKLAERKRYGDVDSEAIAALLAKEGDLVGLGRVISEIVGDAAVAAVDERDGGRLALARGSGSPLYVYDGKRIVMFGSTAESISFPHKQVIGKVSDRKIKHLEEGTFMSWGGTKAFLKKSLILPTYVPVRTTKTYYNAPVPTKMKKPIGQTSAFKDKGWDPEPDPFAYCDYCGGDIYEDDLAESERYTGDSWMHLCPDCMGDSSVERALGLDSRTDEFQQANDAVVAELDAQLEQVTTAEQKRQVIADFLARF